MAKFGRSQLEPKSLIWAYFFKLAQSPSQLLSELEEGHIDPIKGTENRSYLFRDFLQILNISPNSQTTPLSPGVSSGPIGLYFVSLPLLSTFTGMLLLALILAFLPPLVLLVLRPQGHPSQPCKSCPHPGFLQGTLPVSEIIHHCPEGNFRKDSCQ